ncbi:hypothetical protein D9M73_210460 [compost metagenome]
MATPFSSIAAWPAKRSPLANNRAGIDDGNGFQAALAPGDADNAVMVTDSAIGLFREKHAKVLTASQRLARQGPAFVQLLLVEGIIAQHFHRATFNGAHAGRARADHA